MSIERKHFIEYPFDKITKKDFIDFVNDSIKKNEKHVVAVQNANKMYLSEKNVELKKYISLASVILPENAINIGMMFLGEKLPEWNVGGYPMMEELLLYANINNLSIYLLGTTQSNLIQLIDKIITKYPHVKIYGSHNGYFSHSEEENIIDEISILSPNLLFIGMGSPKQEKFIIKNINVLKCNIIMGVGGSFNVIAGLEKPAPKWTRYGLEWLYRSFQDYSKFKRYFIINSFFLFKFVKYFFIRK